MHPVSNPASLTQASSGPGMTKHHVGFVALSAEIRITISTDEAAFHLGRKPQTLRKWACYEDGPLRPVRVNGRLAWRVADLLRVLNKGSAK